MLKSCPHCGRVHDSKIMCSQKKAAQKEWAEKRKKENLALYKFRNSEAWKRKTKHIRERDCNLCLVCLSYFKYTPADSVHHIVPLAVDFGQRLDDDNLISLCRYHHELADSKKISADLLRGLVKTPPGGLPK